MHDRRKVCNTLSKMKSYIAKISQILQKYKLPSYVPFITLQRKFNFYFTSSTTHNREYYFLYRRTIPYGNITISFMKLEADQTKRTGGQ